jgi:hypothetical protein
VGRTTVHEKPPGRKRTQGLGEGEAEPYSAPLTSLAERVGVRAGRGHQDGEHPEHQADAREDRERATLTDETVYAYPSLVNACQRGPST